MKDLHEVRNMRQVFDKGFFMGGALASAMTVTKGNLPPKEYRDGAERRRTPHPRRPRAELSRRRTASSRSTSSRRSSSPGTGRATTSRTTSGSSGTCRATSRTLWVHMCPAHVYEVGAADGDGTVTVEREPVELRPVRRDHRQGRPADPARGRLRARVHAHLVTVCYLSGRARPRPCRSAPRRRDGCRRAGATTRGDRGRSATRP